MRQLIIDRIQYYYDHPRKVRDGEGWQTSAIKPPKPLSDMTNTELLNFFEDVVTLYERFSSHNVANVAIHTTKPFTCKTTLPGNSRLV